jgi:hypothetical protein
MILRNLKNFETVGKQKQMMMVDPLNWLAVWRIWVDRG